MVFAPNVMHFPDPQDAAMAAMAAAARQLRPGGTFVAVQFDPARFDDHDLQGVWARRQGTADVAPLSTELFVPGTQRIHPNMGSGSIQGVLPPEKASYDIQPNYAGLEDAEAFVDEEGWDFDADLIGVKAHFGSFPFVSQFPDAFEALCKDLGTVMADRRKARGCFPAKIILTTRR